MPLRNVYLSSCIRHPGTTGIFHGALVYDRRLFCRRELSAHLKQFGIDTPLGRTWKYTQNWIAYEVGLASLQNIDVWVLCEDTTINFPVPYFNHYQPFARDVDWTRSMGADRTAFTGSSSVDNKDKDSEGQIV